MPWPSGRKPSPESIEKNRRAQLGKKRSAETREKMRQAALGRVWTEEGRAILREAWKLRAAYRGGKMAMPSCKKTKLVPPTPTIVPDHLLDDYRLFLRKGFRQAEALQMLKLQ